MSDVLESKEVLNGYKYQANHHTIEGYLYSNSLRKLKKAIKRRKWSMAWIQDEYKEFYYQPKYNRRVFMGYNKPNVKGDQEDILWEFLKDLFITK